MKSKFEDLKQKTMKTKYRYNGKGWKSVLFSCSSVLFLLCGCNNIDIIPDVTSAKVPSGIQMIIPADLQKLIYTDGNGAKVLPLIKGQTANIGVALSPEDITSTDVNWSSSETSVATVDSGLITAVSGKGLGYSVITVAPVGMFSGSGVASSLKVKVDDEMIPATNIVLTSDTDIVYIGEQLAIKYDIEPEIATYQTLQWSSSDESIATVNSQGVVTGAGVKGSSISSKVTITATALDGSKIMASKEITVKKVVPPEDVTLDQTYASSVYDCAVADHSLTIKYTTVPMESTTSLIQWSCDHPEIATINNGVVTFNQDGNFGQFTITAKCPATGKESSIKMNLAGGLIREQFDNANHYTWWNATQSGNGTSTSNVIHSDEQGGYITITTYSQNATKQRADFKCWEPKSWIMPGNYPLFAIRLQDVNDLYGYSRNINLDTSGKDLTTGTVFSGVVGGNNNKWLTKYKLSDGSCVLIYNLATQTFANGGLFPMADIGQFTTLQFKYADIGTVDHQITYNVYWVQTFKNEDEIKALVAKEGLTIQ